MLTSRVCSSDLTKLPIIIRCNNHSFTNASKMWLFLFLFLFLFLLWFIVLVLVLVVVYCLKVNMVNPGLDCPKSYSVGEIAAANLQVVYLF